MNKLDKLTGVGTLLLATTAMLGCDPSDSEVNQAVTDTRSLVGDAIYTGDQFANDSRFAQVLGCPHVNKAQFVTDKDGIPKLIVRDTAVNFATEVPIMYKGETIECIKTEIPEFKAKTWEERDCNYGNEARHSDDLITAFYCYGETRITFENNDK